MHARSTFRRSSLPAVALLVLAGLTGASPVTPLDAPAAGAPPGPGADQVPPVHDDLENALRPVLNHPELPARVWTDLNDGPGSGLNADLLDGLQAAQFSLATHHHDGRYYASGSTVQDSLRLSGLPGSDYLLKTGKAADANLLDGLDASQFLRSDVAATKNGDLVLRARLYLGDANQNSDPVFLQRADVGTDVTHLRINVGDEGSDAAVFGYYGSGGGAWTETARVTNAGDIHAAGHIYAHGWSHIGDVAEPVAGAGLAPGDVVVAGGFDALGRLVGARAASPYDPEVIGVVSTNPSILLAGAPGSTPLAVTGIVPVKVVGPVARGALLVSSDVPGHAMACGEPARCFGAILGKALEAHAGGAGQVRAMLALG